MKKIVTNLKKVVRYPLLCLFVVFLVFVFCMDMTSTNRKFSEMENRVLNQRPKLTVEKLVANEYTMEYEEYVNDQFIWRDRWITMKSISESVLQKIENNGVSFGKEGYLFEKYTSLNRQQLEKNLNFVNEYLEKYPDQHVTLAVIPNSYEVLSDKIPSAFPNVAQKPLIDEMYSRIDGENLSKLELLKPLQEHSGEYIYYRTDHHWTTLGAYYAYAEYVQSQGMTPVDLSQFKAYAKEQPDFYGTYHSKAKLYNAQPDVITWYDLPVADVNIDGKEYDGMYDLSKLDIRDKYASFLWGNHGLTKIVVNEGVENPKRVMLIKDSYGNSLAPFLTANYDEVWVVDLRHVFSLSAVLQQAGEEPFDDVLLMYNYMNFVQDTNLAKLRY
ncbi:MAG: hypothetical protein IKU72_02910 [Oscillospiraceae bacterium]|nr:hypothetical protein [Oscillospiraceae bacterium]